MKTLQQAQDERNEALRDQLKQEDAIARYEDGIRKTQYRAEHQAEHEDFKRAKTDAEIKKQLAEERYDLAQHNVSDAKVREANGNPDRLDQLDKADQEQRARVHASATGANYDSPEVQKNMNTAMDYHDRHGSSEKDIHQWTQGSDLHKPVEIKEVGPGHEFSQRVRSREPPEPYIAEVDEEGELRRPPASNPRPGQYASGRGESADRTGIDGASREYHVGRTKERVEYLESSAAPMKDRFTDRDKTTDTRGGAKQQYLAKEEMHKVEWKGRDDRISEYQPAFSSRSHFDFEIRQEFGTMSRLGGGKWEMSDQRGKADQAWDGHGHGKERTTTQALKEEEKAHESARESTAAAAPRTQEKADDEKDAKKSKDQEPESESKGATRDGPAERER